MDRTETKCAGQIRYKTLAGARKMAAGTNGIYEAHGCECKGFHISKVNQTPREKERDANDAYYGDFLQLVRTMINRELRNRRARRKR